MELGWCEKWICNAFLILNCYISVVEEANPMLSVVGPLGSTQMWLLNYLNSKQMKWEVWTASKISWLFLDVKGVQQWAHQDIKVLIWIHSVMVPPPGRQLSPDIFNSKPHLGRWNLVLFKVNLLWSWYKCQRDVLHTPTSDEWESQGHFLLVLPERTKPHLLRPRDRTTSGNCKDWL